MNFGSQKPDPPPADGHVVERLSARSRKKQRPVYRLHRPAGAGYAVPEFSRACLIRLIDYPEMPLRTKTSEIIKAGNSALLVRTELPIANRMCSVAYKRVRRKSWLKWFTALFRGNRTLRSWRLGHALLARGIATARPLAVIVPPHLKPDGYSFLATEWLDGGSNLYWYHQWIEGLDRKQQYHRLKAASQSVAQLVGGMHAKRVSHRDLKPGNMMLANRGDNVDAFVIDLDGADIRFLLSKTTRLRNLSRLVVGVETFAAVGNTTRLRFLKEYLQAIGEADHEWKQTWRQLEKISETRGRQINRRIARKAA